MTTGIAWTAVEDAIQAWAVAGTGLAADHVVWAAQASSGAPRPPRPSGPFVELRIVAIAPLGRDWRDRAPNVITLTPIAVTAVNVDASSLTAPSHGLATGTGPLNVASTGTLPTPIAANENVWPIVLDANTLQVASSFVDAMTSPPVPIELTGAGSGTITIESTPTTTVAGREIDQRVRGPRVATLELTAFAGTGGTGIGSSSPLALLDGVVAQASDEETSFQLAAAGIGVGVWERIRAIGSVVNATEFEPRAFTSVTLNLASEVVTTSTFIETIEATDNIPTPPESITISATDDEA